MQPPCPTAGRQDEFLARVERLGLSHGDIGVDRARAPWVGVSDASGLSKLRSQSL